MKTGKGCPKCNGANIIRIEGSVKGYGTGNNIPIGATIFSYVKVPRYVCCDCGYSEEWIDLKDIPRLKKKFK
ncbi:hypothetical protein GCM10008908_01710 [Clostridium subterminale]|uniref:YgiT-type zinc finger protein n=1 Tax=Clostridium subterminale TaxID=1550 RepID=A0ABN1KFH8_CLOSU